ncbi:BTAD domain-containing putative transcriptional regulator [Patulibacter sp. SYSU D01012]|uniref:BTAD domain-containing putative transcriptional regulator n=1 Tax=Patulibacter sp. SYSU D01012 TaxID=2817381 RepID=UPI001B3046CB
MRFRVLGPLEAEDARGVVDLKGPRHRAVLARLLVAEGRVVPAATLVEDLWDHPPDGALGALQTFVGALRKALEPDRPPRSPARLLVTVAPGYALRAARQDVDAWRFADLVATAGDDLTAGRADAALAGLDDALALWRGPAYPEAADHDWGRAAAAALDELRALAVSRRAEAFLALGRPADAVPALEALVGERPLHEPGWGLLGLALYRAGRQGDALAAVRRARTALREHAGLDPGAALRTLEADLLAQSPALDRAGAAAGAGRVREDPGRADAAGTTGTGPPPVVGRDAELAALLRAADGVRSVGAPRLAVVSGAPGAGKTALTDALAGRLRAAGWRTGRGAAPELPGAPDAWPWAQVEATLGTPAADAGDAGADPLAARFRRHRAAAQALAAVTARGPVLVVLDDLHWADEETLGRLTAVAGDAAAGPVLLVGTYRTTEVPTPLADALARAARLEPARVYLGGLDRDAVAALAAGVVGRPLPEADARAIHARSGGNPFLARELARVWDAEGLAGLDAVPAGVRDVLRQRLARLPAPALGVLRRAAILGDAVDLDVLVPLVGDEEAVLDAVEHALLAGLLTEDGTGLRFAHALVRETVHDDVPVARRVRWHAAAAAALRARRPDDAEAIAHHAVRAGDRAPAEDVARDARRAAERAEARFAPADAAGWWQAALDAQHRGGSADPRARLQARMGLVRAAAVGGDLATARRRRAAALDDAQALGDPVLVAEAIGASVVPAAWTTNDDEALAARIADAAEHALAALPPGHDVHRTRLLAAIATERRADAGRGAEAAAAAEALARRSGDPALLALALNARWLQAFSRAGLAPERAAIGEELLAIAGKGEGLTAHAVLGHLVVLQARTALADLDAADRHAAAADALAARHGLPLVAVFTAGYAALRAAIRGRHDEARAAYRTLGVRLRGAGMPGVEAGIVPLALLALDLPRVDAAQADAAFGPYAPWVRPLLLLAEGDAEAARAAAARTPASPGDVLLEARLTLQAVAAVRTGDRAAAERLHAALLPAADELAGAGSGMVTTGPVALHLAALAETLGRPRDAAAHLRRAAAVAGRVGAPHWAAQAADGLRRLGG